MITITRRSALLAVGALGTAGLDRAARAVDAPIELRCSIETPPHHARNIFTRAYLDMVREASRGRIAPHLFESGSLFADRDVPKAIMQGQVEMALPLTFLMSGFVRDANVFELPICYGREPAEVMKLVRGPVGQEIANQLMQRLHVHVLGEWLPDGFENFFGTRRPLNTYADLKGLKVRSPGGFLQSKRLSFLGAIPVEVPWPQVPLAMTQGMFDALVTVDDSAVAAKLWDAGMHYGLEDRQELVQYVPIVSGAFWNKLTPDLQKLMTDIWAGHIHDWQAKTLEDADIAVKSLSEAGVQIVIAPRSMVIDFRTSMLPMQDAWAKEGGISPRMVALANEAFGGKT